MTTIHETAFSCCHIAYFFVHANAVVLYFCLSVLYIRATSGTSGSSGLGSFNNEQIERRTSVETIVKVRTFWEIVTSKFFTGIQKLSFSRRPPPQEYCQSVHHPPLPRKYKCVCWKVDKWMTPWRFLIQNTINQNILFYKSFLSMTVDMLREAAL